MSLSETERAELAADLRGWPTAAVERAVFYGLSVKGYDGGASKRIALAELLRRERERCVAECEAQVCHEADPYAETACRTCAERIRGLQ